MLWSIRNINQNENRIYYEKVIINLQQLQFILFLLLFSTAIAASVKLGNKSDIKYIFYTIFILYVVFFVPSYFTYYFEVKHRFIG